MYGLSDDMATMAEGLRKTRTLIKKAYDALKKGNADLSKEFLKQADQEALDGLPMIGEEDKKGLDGKPIKARWEK